MNQTYTINFPENYTKPKLPGRDQWTAALRSGKYGQGKGRLRVDNNYCCLGILCELQGRLIKENGIWVDPYDYAKEDEDCGAECSLSGDNPLAKELRDLGSFPEDLYVESDQHIIYHALSELNDSGFVFNQIADIIEAIWDNE